MQKIVDQLDAKIHAKEQPMSQILAEIARGLGIPFAALARTQNATRGDGKLSPATIWRWCRKGVRLDDGTVIHLEHARLGGRWLTTEAAFLRFIAAQNPEVTTEAVPAPVRSTSKRSRAHARAAAELADAGA